MCMEQWVKSNAGILLKLCADLFADLKDHLLLVRQVEILYQSLSKLIGRDQSLVEVPEERVPQSVRDCQLARPP